MLRVSPSVAEETIQTDFAVTAAAFGFAMGLYYYAYAPMQLLVGVLLDAVGSRRPLAVACLTAGTGAAVFAMAGSVEVLGGGRFLAGLGSSVAYVGTIYVASVWFPATRIALLAGITAALGMAGAIAGETVLVWVDGAFGWRNAAWGFAILGGLIGIGIWFVVPRRPAWLETRVSASRAAHGSSVFCGLWCVLRNRNTWMLSVIAGLMYLPVGVFAAMWGDRYLTEGIGLGTAQSANADAMMFAGFGIAAPLLGWLSDRTGRRRVMLLVGAVIGLLGTAGVLLVPASAAWACFPLLFVIGFGLGSIVIAFPLAMDLNPHHARGAAITFINFFQMLLAGVGQWVVGLILDGGSDHAAEGLYSRGDFQSAFLILPGGLILSIVLLLMLRDLPQADD
ncbi:MAG: MFS transporter [Phycisphaerales bacterium]|nr:MFS transporter [Phycisphaerales bacterium]